MTHHQPQRDQSSSSTNNDRAQQLFLSPRFHVSGSSPRLDATLSPSFYAADSAYNPNAYSSSSSPSPALSHLSPRSGSPSSSSIGGLASNLSHFQIPDRNHQLPTPHSFSSSTVFQPPPQPGVSAPKKKKTHSKPRPEGHVPRPRNPFIMFRMDVVGKKLITSENKHQNISKVVADMWKALTPREKEPYLAAAKREKEDHSLKYPNYVYQPSGDKVVEGGKSPKRVQGSKASLKATASKEKKAREAELNQERIKREEEGEDDDEYVSSSTSKSKKRSRPKRKPRASKAAPKPSRRISSMSNSESDHSLDTDDGDFYFDSRSRPVIPIRGSSSRGGQESSDQLSLSSFSSQGTHWESSTDEGGDPHRMEDVLRFGFPGSRSFGSLEKREGGNDEDHPTLPHYQQRSQQPTYAYPNQQQAQYQPQAGQLTYSTYSDYPMPSQLSPSFSTSTVATSSLLPFNRHLSHSIHRPPHEPYSNSEFLPTDGPSPLTPGFPNLPTPGLQGHGRRSSFLSSAVRYGSTDGLTPRTRQFWESAGLEITSAIMAPPRRTRGHQVGPSSELSELFTREPLMSPRARESANRTQTKESWHIGSDHLFNAPAPADEGLDHSLHFAHQLPAALSSRFRPSIAPFYSHSMPSGTSLNEIPSPPPSSDGLLQHPTPQYTQSLFPSSLDLSRRRKGRPQALSLLSLGRPSLSNKHLGGTSGSAFTTLDEPTPTQASFNMGGAFNRPDYHQHQEFVQSEQYQEGSQGGGPATGTAMMFDDGWRPKAEYIPLIEAPWFIGMQ